MSEEKKYKRFTATDIEKYHKGLLSSAEMHEMEKQALDDPFLADAIEGYGSVSVDVSSDLEELREQLAHRVQESKGRSPALITKWWRAAAAAAILGVLGFVAYSLLNHTSNKSVAQVDEQKKIPAKTMQDSSQLPVDTISAPAGIVGVPKLRNEKSRGREKLTPVTSDSAQLFKAAGRKASNTYSFSPAARNVDSVLMQQRPVSAAKPVEKERVIRIDKLAEASSTRSDVEKQEQPINRFFGRVTDSADNPLPFANISSTHSHVGTYADAQGFFALVATDSVLSVQVRSVGFLNQTTKLRSDVRENKIVLAEEDGALDKILSLNNREQGLHERSTLRFEEPQPADGWANYQLYLANNINVPAEVINKKETGQVGLSFEVDKNGAPTDIKIESSLCQKCDEEAIRLVRQGPKWTKQAKKPQRVVLSVPFDSQQ